MCFKMIFYLLYFLVSNLESCDFECFKNVIFDVIFIRLWDNKFILWSGILILNIVIIYIFLIIHLILECKLIILICIFSIIHSPELIDYILHQADSSKKNLLILQLDPIVSLDFANFIWIFNDCHENFKTSTFFLSLRK